jgi:hypothetical protein
MIVVNGKIATAKILIRMNYDFEAMTVHATTFVARGHLRQTMSRLKRVPTPDMCLAGSIKVHALMQCALDTHLLDTGNLEVLPKPARDVLVGGLPNGRSIGCSQAARFATQEPFEVPPPQRH